MKKLILAATVLGLAGLGLQNAKASDLGKFIKGAVDIHVAALHTVASVVHDVTPRVNVNVGYSQPAYCPPVQTTYCAPEPAYCAPAPRVVYVPAPAPRVVYYQSAPVYYHAPVHFAPRVVVSYRDRDYRGHDDHRDHRGDRDGHRDGGYRR